MALLASAATQPVYTAPVAGSVTSSVTVTITGPAVSAAPAKPSPVWRVPAPLNPNSREAVPRTALAFPGVNLETLATAADFFALSNSETVLVAGDAAMPSPPPSSSPHHKPLDFIVYSAARNEAANVPAFLKRLVPLPPLDGQMEAGPSVDSPTAVFSGDPQVPIEILFHWLAGLVASQELRLSSFPLGATYYMF